MTTPKPTVSPHVNIDLSLLIFYQPPIEKLTNHLLTQPAMYAQLLAKKQVQEQQNSPIMKLRTAMMVLRLPKKILKI